MQYVDSSRITSNSAILFNNGRIDGLARRPLLTANRFTYLLKTLLDAHAATY